MQRKRRAKSSDTWTWELSQLECVKRGWHVERVDYTSFGYSHDLFGVFDALAWEESSPDGPAGLIGTTYAIQYTSASNRAARRRKVEACPILPLLKAAGWVPLVWAWRIDGSGHPVLSEDLV